MDLAYLLGDWATDWRATASLGDGETTDTYQACLIFSPPTDRPVTKGPSGYGPLDGTWLVIFVSGQVSALMQPCRHLTQADTWVITYLIILTQLVLFINCE